MNTSEIKPRTLIAVLAAHIKEEAETIARSIIEQAKSSEVEYSNLVEQFILNKTRTGNISFTSFAEKAFEEIKDTDKLIGFKVELETNFRQVQIFLEFKTKLASKMADIEGDITEVEFPK